jgi:hypothetical protein
MAGAGSAAANGLRGSHNRAFAGAGRSSALADPANSLADLAHSMADPVHSRADLMNSMADPVHSRADRSSARAGGADFRVRRAIFPDDVARAS